MARKRIRFQPWMSVREFNAQRGTKERFVAALEQTC